MWWQQVGRNGRCLSRTALQSARASREQLLRQRQRGQHQVRKYAAETETPTATTASVKPPPNPSRLRQGLILVVVGATFSALGAAGTLQALKAQNLGFLSDEDSLRVLLPGAADEEARMAEDTMQKHPLVAELRARPDLQESRPYLKFPPDRRRHSLTAGSLSGPHRMAVSPMVFTDNDGKTIVSIAYLGDELCGHPPFVHGGMLATILDEGLARCCFKALPHNTAVTANLNVDYRKPARSGGFYVLRGETERVDGRKAWVRGRIETLAEPGETPIVVAEATALFISPKYAAILPKFR